MQRCDSCGFCLACGDVDPGQACPMCGGGAYTASKEAAKVEPIRSR